MSKNYLFSLLLTTQFFFGRETDYLKLFPQDVAKQIIKFDIASHLLADKDNFYQLLKRINTLRSVDSQWKTYIDTDASLNFFIIKYLSIALDLHKILMLAEFADLKKQETLLRIQQSPQRKVGACVSKNGIYNSLHPSSQMGYKATLIKERVTQIDRVNDFSSDINIFAAIALGTPAAIKLVKEKVGEEKYKQAMKIYNEPTEEDF